MISETTLLWILGAIITVQSTVIGAIATALWVHVGHCRETSATQARIDANVKRLTEDIGTHETGLRGEVHKHGKDFVKVFDKLEEIMRRIE